MNTTLQPITDRTLRRHLRQAWCAFYPQKPQASSHAAYALALGLSIDKMFTPLVRPSKIEGYASGNPHLARDHALRLAENGSVAAWKPWAELLKEVPQKYGYYQGGWPAIHQALSQHAVVITMETASASASLTA